VKGLRSLAAVVAGYRVFAVSAVLLFRLSGIDPHTHQPATFMRFAVIYGMGFAALGGVVTVYLASGRPALHAALLSAVIALGASISLIARPGAGATWSQWGAFLLMAPWASLAPRIIGKQQGAG
jgi:hypothetical protein